ncbi:hypothetical protein OF829_18380 [Sphingomonas sp. LB-2]|uniref:hypothetical protein n=1 Tax=Sphingomonas caeni TaxID=2984949 RepID=UPI0022307DF1|nr:hypothetical protein [Sphingomonas caeni]MCW3849209.1 hypothetical protein [Sphingomonas caeni]
MPMMLAMALFAQTAAPQNETEAEAMKCVEAVVEVNQTESISRMRANAETVYYLMQAAHATAGDDPDALFARFEELSVKLDDLPKPSPAQAEAQARQCDVRFPLARKELATLPADRFKAEVMCITVLPMVEDFATGLQEQNHDAAEPLRWKRLIGILNSRLEDDVMGSHGYTSYEQKSALIGAQFSASLQVGNIYAIARACEILEKD